MPAKDLSTKSLQQHTLDNAVADFVSFAKNASIPFDKSGQSNAPQAVSSLQ